VIPEERDGMTAVDVMRAAEGTKRDRATHDWCRSVRTAFSANRGIVAELLKHRII
jgi:hypothetical protein